MCKSKSKAQNEIQSWFIMNYHIGVSNLGKAKRLQNYNQPIDWIEFVRTQLDHEVQQHSFIAIA